jgi:hypothetical protein
VAAFARVKVFQCELMEAGVQTHRRYGLLRADERALADFYPMMDLSMSSAQVYSVNRKAPSSALFMVEARAIKSMDF